MVHSSPDFPKIYLLGGLTGSGKTELLHHLYKAGQQVLDLEDLCCHDGSAFAALRYTAQPTSYQFHKKLNKLWQNFDVHRPVFMEQELQKIGNLTLPGWLYKHMQKAPIIWLHTKKEIRAQRLESLVRRSDPVLFCDCVQKLSIRLGDPVTNDIIQYFSTGDIGKSIELLLQYYDNSNGYRQLHDRILLQLEIDRPDMGYYCHTLLNSLPVPTLI